MSPTGDLESRIARLEDKDEIAAAIYKYCSRLDKRDIKGLCEVLTEDFKLAFPGWQLEVDGRENVTQYYIEQLYPSHEFNNHKVMNITIDLQDRDANCEAILHLHSSCMNEPQEAIIRYDMHLRKEPGGWKLAAITCFVIYWKGSLAPQDESTYERFSYAG